MPADRHHRSAREHDVAKAVASIEQKFGVSALQRLGALPRTNVDTLPTGINALDLLLGVGGWPRGRICEVFGPEASASPRSCCTR
jgi:recombination protein RecA